MIDPSATRLDLDDSRVLQVRRKKGVVTIELEQRRGSTVKRIVVVVSGVTQEDTEYYIGNDVTAPHPDPALPLDYIEFSVLGVNYLELSGYRKNESWFVWRIGSGDIEIKEETEFAT